MTFCGKHVSRRIICPTELPFRRRLRASSYSLMLKRSSACACRTAGLVRKVPAVRNQPLLHMPEGKDFPCIVESHCRLRIRFVDPDFEQSSHRTLVGSRGGALSGSLLHFPMVSRQRCHGYLEHVCTFALASLYKYVYIATICTLEIHDCFLDVLCTSPVFCS